jgi:hypothetical protein
MFKNSILRYLNSAATFDAENEGKSAAQLQREAIAKTMAVAPKEGEESNKDKNEDKDENDTDDKEDDKEKDEDDEDKEEDENEDDKKAPENETEEQKTARLAEEKKQVKEQRKYERMQRRIDKVAAERDLTRTENEELKKQLAAKTVEGLTEEEVNARAKKIAEGIVNERNVANAQKQFEKDCDTLQKEALKVNKKFNEEVHEMAEEVAPIPGIMIGILVDLDNENGSKVLNYLAQNVDEYEKMFTGDVDAKGNMIPISEGRMTAKLIRLSDKLKAEEDKAKAYKKKEHSNVPPPVTPVTEGRDVRTANALPSNPTKNMDEFVRIRNQQEADRRKQRGY